VEVLAVHGLVPVSEMTPVLARAALSVPVYGRAGIRAFAVVDPEDYALCAGYRWRLSADGYVVTNTSRGAGKRTTLRMSRAIMGLEHGDPLQVDHKNLDPLDNRRSNLRLVTNAQNCQNRRHRGGSSRFRGVTWQKDVRKWKAQVRFEGEHYYLGLFETEQEAADAAAAWRELHMPFTTN
jgi:hypothetical protein